MESTITTHGLHMPKLGLGTWPMLGEECTRAVRQGLELGYRHIDTATRYENEAAIGEALAGSAVPRGEIHVTTKVWWDSLAPEAMRRSMENSLRALRTEYVDLFLVHWPAKDWDLPRTMEALVRLKDEGKARAIGVANFPLALLRRTVEELGVPVACNQVEYHVLLGQSALLAYMQPKGIALTAYSPIARNTVAEVPEMQAIARKHGAAPSQVALAWLLGQDGVAAVPKASGRANQQSNLDARNLRLDAEDLATIAALPKDRRMVNPDFAPAWDPVG